MKVIISSSSNVTTAYNGTKCRSFLFMGVVHDIDIGCVAVRFPIAWKFIPSI